MTRADENISTPPSDARVIELLSGHPDSDEFIEEYRWRRKTHDIEKAMIITGEVFFRKHNQRYRRRVRGRAAPSDERGLRPFVC